MKLLCVCTWASAVGEFISEKLFSESPRGRDPPKAPRCFSPLLSGGPSLEEPQAGCVALIGPDLLSSFSFKEHLMVEVTGRGLEEMSCEVLPSCNLSDWAGGSAGSGGVDGRGHIVSLESPG